jgi:hypothetical protein
MVRDAGPRDGEDTGLMLEEIRGELSRIEKEHDVRILLAVESGSRAWGFCVEG